MLGGLNCSYRASLARDSDYDKENRVGYLPEAPGTFSVRADEARGQVEDCIVCDKVKKKTTNFR